MSGDITTSGRVTVSYWGLGDVQLSATTLWHQRDMPKSCKVESSYTYVGLTVFFLLLSCTRKRAKSSITQASIIRFRSNFSHSLSTWQSKCHRSFWSRAQRSRLQRDITYQHQKSAIIRARMRCRTSNLVKISSEPSAIRYMAFKVIRSNIKIAITPPRIDRLRSNLV